MNLDEHVYESLRLGANGFLLKDMPAEDITIAIRPAARGIDALLAPAVTQCLIDRFARAKLRPAPDQRNPPCVCELGHTRVSHRSYGIRRSSS